MSTILVTGANGFVGHALCATLRQRGIGVRAAVRRAQGDAVAVGELSADTDWSAALAGCDAVIHLAARVHVMDEKVADPLRAFREVNVEATLNLARQAKAQGIRRFVFVSSIKVNGEATTDRPFSAFDTPAPADPYGVSKLEAEQGLRELTRDGAMELVIVRPPLVYGPGVRANFRSLMRLAAAGLPLPLGAIRDRRSMVALDNLVDLLITCAFHPQAGGQVFLVSDDHDVSVPELLRMLAKAQGKRAWLLPVPPALLGAAAALLGKRAVARRLLGSLQVDIGHTKAVLGWEPPISMQEGIGRAVAQAPGQAVSPEAMRTQH